METEKRASAALENHLSLQYIWHPKEQMVHIN